MPKLVCILAPVIALDCGQKALLFVLNTVIVMVQAGLLSYLYWWLIGSQGQRRNVTLSSWLEQGIQLLYLLGMGQLYSRPGTAESLQRLRKYDKVATYLY